MRTAVIVGGGIGGLATGIALGRRGWEVEILEQATEFAEVGAGISLWANALHALDALGVGEAVRDRGRIEGQTGIRDSAGRWLSRSDTTEFERRFGPTVMLHRADLLDVLRAAVADAGLRLRTEVTDCDAANGVVTHSGGTSEADLIVGADGIRSRVRGAVLGRDIRPRYAGYTSWRMVTPRVPIDGGSESWGRGERFGYAPLPDGRVYCYAVANAAAGYAGRGLAGLRERFAHWHDPIPKLLSTVTEDVVLHHDLYDLPNLPTYVTDRVALVGDAAHAMTPNLGQGACVSLEDAVVLADAMDGDGLGAYDAARRPRTQAIVARSRRIGAVAQWQSPAAVMLRNTLIRATPASSFTRNLAPVLTWSA